MPKHIWVVEFVDYDKSGKKGWKPDPNKENHCLYWKDKQSAIYAMDNCHHGHHKDLRVSKYVKEDK